MTQSPTNTPSNKDDVKDILHEAAIKAMKATNLCEKHMKYHGQQTPECTPIERQMVELTTPSNNELEREIHELVALAMEKFHKADGFYNGVAHDTTQIILKLFENWANKKVIEGRIDELKHIQSEYGGRFAAVTYITGDAQTIEARYNDLLEALRKKGDNNEH